MSEKEFGEVSDSEIEAVFEGTNFGAVRSYRKLLEQGVLKNAASYRSGHTLFCIMVELGLMTKKDRVTKKGFRFLFLAFKDSKNSG